MQLYDSLKKELKSFPEKEDEDILIYACGPTVYHYAHIGNLRTFLTVDLLRRYLEYKGKKVKLVMNITDVGHMLNDAEDGEDKIEAAARREGKTQEEIARFYEQAFFDDLDALHFKREDTAFPRATANVKYAGGMIELVKTLLDKGLAYATEQGDIYYDVAKFENYGNLSGNTVESLKAGARVEVKEDKKHPADFALWIHNDAHQMQWEFEWTDPRVGTARTFRGYPGWHLECSAMAQKYLASTIDLHAGGEDLKFPHHECEIAQSEGATGAVFSRHWLHVTYLVVDGEKMSKSKGNFYTLQDLLNKGHSAEAVRIMLLSAHYRTQLNFTMEGLKASEDQLRYLQELAARLQQFEQKGPLGSDEEDLLDNIPKFWSSKFEEGLEKDVNVAIAWSSVIQFATAMNKVIAEKKMVQSLASYGLQFLEKFEAVMGIGIFKQAIINIPTEVEVLKHQRELARIEKRWQDSDRLRDEIAAKGWIVEDTPQGQKLRQA